MKKKENVTLFHKSFIEKQEFFSRMRTFLQYAGWILVFLFSGLQLQQIFTKTPPTINDTFTQILFKVTIACLYSSWVYGLNFDLNDQEFTLVKTPNKGKLTSNLIGVIISLVILFGVLTYLTELKHLNYFVIALTIFSLSGSYGEYQTAQFGKKAIEDNRKEYINSNDFIGELSLNTIEHYLTGKWHWTRFYAGIPILIFINILAFTNLASIIATKLHIPSEKLIVVCGIILYFLVKEVWNWYERINRKIRLTVLNDIGEKYELVEKK